MQNFFDSTESNQDSLDDLENFINLIGLNLFGNSELPLSYQDKNEDYQNYSDKYNEQEKNGHNQYNNNERNNSSNYANKTMNESNNDRGNNRFYKDIKNQREADNKYVDNNVNFKPKTSNLNINYRRHKIYDV